MAPFISEDAVDGDGPGPGLLPSFLMSVLLASSLPSPLSLIGLISPLLSYVPPVSLSSFSPLNDDLHSKVEIFGIIS